MLTFPLSEYVPLLPIAFLVLAGLLALVADLFLKPEAKVALSLIALGGVCLAALSAAAFWTGIHEEPILGGALAISRLGFTLSIGVLTGAGAAALYSAHYAENTPVATGEHYGLLMFATAGMLALVVANDLGTLFVALETLSISVYALTGTFRAKARAAEGAMKYFVLGAFSSGFLLYGIALIYGSAGTLRLDEIARNGVGVGGPLAVVGVCFLLVGLLFKVGAVPFHAWIPDAYTAAPAGVTGFMSVSVKAAAFGAALRVLVSTGVHPNLTFHLDHTGGLHLGWILCIAAALTMILGNAGALAQSNPRRLLAYSGIAHTGYALVGLVAIARFADGQRGIYNPPGLDLVAVAHDAAAGVLYYLVGLRRREPRGVLGPLLPRARGRGRRGHPAPGGALPDPSVRRARHDDRHDLARRSAAHVGLHRQALGLQGRDRRRRLGPRRPRRPHERALARLLPARRRHHVHAPARRSRPDRAGRGAASLAPRRRLVALGRAAGVHAHGRGDDRARSGSRRSPRPGDHERQRTVLIEPVRLLIFPA